LILLFIQICSFDIKSKVSADKNFFICALDNKENAASCGQCRASLIIASGAATFRLVPSLQSWRTCSRCLYGIPSLMRAPPRYLRSVYIVYSLKVIKTHTFAADTRNSTGERVRVTGRKGAEGCRETTKALEAQDGEAKPNRHASKKRNH